MPTSAGSPTASPTAGVESHPQPSVFQDANLRLETFRQFSGSRRLPVNVLRLRSFFVGQAHAGAFAPQICLRGARQRSQTRWYLHRTIYPKADAGGSEHQQEALVAPGRHLLLAMPRPNSEKANPTHVSHLPAAQRLSNPAHARVSARANLPHHYPWSRHRRFPRTPWYRFSARCPGAALRGAEARRRDCDQTLLS
jgi:hypothetical protein